MRLSFVLCVVGLFGCESSPSTAPLPEVRELDVSSFMTPAGSPVVLRHAWEGFAVPFDSNGCSAVVANAATAGRPEFDRAVLRFDVWSRPGAPNGGLLRNLVTERYTPDTQGATKVPLDPQALCAGAACPDSLRADCRNPAPLADEGLLVAGRLSSWSASDPPFGHFLLRFRRTGELAFSVPLPAQPFAQVERSVVTELKSGALAVSYDADAGVVVEVRSAEGAAQHTGLLPDLVVADSGDGLPAMGVAWVSRLKPSREGGFFAIGFRFFTRDIACGSQEKPRPPEGTVCTQSTSHSMLARYAADGTLQWVRDFADDFSTPPSALYDLVELADGSLVATGALAKRGARVLEPLLGAGLVRLTAEGRVTSRVRVCPCDTLLKLSAQPKLMTPLERGNGVVDVLGSWGSRAPLRLLRFSADDELEVVRDFVSSSGAAASLPPPMDFGQAWYLNDANQEMQSFRLEP